MSEIVKFFQSESVKNRFQEILGDKANSFLISISQAVTSNKLLQTASRETIYNAAVTAALLDLPINASLGYAYIVPYKGEAQFQIGYKGLIQLALRTGKFLRINASDVREGELVIRNRLTGDIVFNWLSDEERANLKVVGYVSYFKLNNGFESTYYMSASEMEAHAKRYSQTYKAGKGVWIENFEAMALKTVLKLNLAKNAPLSPQLQQAIESDQAVITNNGTIYVDNQPDTQGIDDVAETILKITETEDVNQNNQNNQNNQQKLQL